MVSDNFSDLFVLDRIQIAKLSSTIAESGIQLTLPRRLKNLSLDWQITMRQERQFASLMFLSAKQTAYLCALAYFVYTMVRSSGYTLLWRYARSTTLLFNHYAT